MKSLLTRLVLVVVAALAPTMVFHVYTANQAHNVRQQLVKDESLRLMYLVNAEQQRILEGAAQVLDTVSVALAVQGNQPEFCQRLLKDLLVREPRYGNAGVIGLDGRLGCSADPNGSGVDLSDRAYFQDVLRTGGLVVGEYMVGRVLHTPAFVIAQPLRNGEGTITGVLEISLTLVWFGQQLDQIPLPDGAVALIADRDGTVLARRPDGARYVGKPIPGDNRPLLQGTQTGVSLVRDLDGRLMSIAYAPPGYSPTGLAVGVGVDPDTAFAVVARADRIGLLLVVAGGILALALTALLGNHLIRRPALQLLQAAARWRKGALATRTNLAGDASEFGQIGAALDEMAAALERRERAVQTALESTTDAVIVVDHAWHVTYINRHARLLTGGGDLVGQSFWGAFPDLERGEFATICDNARDSGLPAKIETVCGIGNWLFETSVFPSDAGLTLYMRDVTEEHRIATALHESEIRLELARDAVGVGVWNTDLENRESDWSDHKWHLHGLEPRPAGAHVETWRATIHPDDRDRMDAEITASLTRADYPYLTEHRVVWPDRTVHWLLTCGTVVRDKSGKAVRIVGITMDVTATRKAEAALRESEARLQLAREAAGFGVWDRDVARDTMVWSVELWRLHGREPRADAPDNDTWRSWIHPDDRGRVDAASLAALGNPFDQFKCEYRVVWPNGAVRWLEARSIISRDPRGEPVRIVGVAFDVTEKRENEAVLRRLSSELEQRVREEVVAREAAQTRATQAERVQALGQLAGGIAHDFNNILQSVSGAMTMIARRRGDETAVLRLIRLADEAIDRGASITRRLLTFGRRGDLHVEAVDVLTLLNGLQEMLIHTLGANIEVTVSSAIHLPPIMADKRQLEAVLVNLATNARDAMTGGGRLLLAVEAEIVSPAGPPHPAGIEPGAYVRLSVSDTGAGMDAETLARAREPFFTTKKLGAGTGLGLAMAQNFVEQSRGALRLESRQGEGTTVTLWLPQAETAPALQTLDPARTRIMGPATRPRVLVVDDEAMIREVIADYLTDGGYSVLVAANGAEALVLLATESAVDALITDLSMPGMDGLAVIRSARERYPALPAILLTGYAGDDAALALGRSIGGAVALLRKPISDVQLLDCLGAMLAVGGDDARPIVDVAVAD